MSGQWFSQGIFFTYLLLEVALNINTSTIDDISNKNNHTVNTIMTLSFYVIQFLDTRYF